MSFYDELEQIKAAIRERNVGSKDSKQSYGRTTGRAGDVLLFGPYRIRQDEWESLTAQAGIPGAPWYDRQAQDVVVEHKLTEMFNQYGGRWDMAVAGWEAGSVIADRLYSGESIRQVVKGDGAEGLQVFINDVMASAGEPATGAAPVVDIAAQSPFANAPLVDARPSAVRQRRTPEEVVKGALTAMRNSQVKSGMQQDEQGGEVSTSGLDMAGQ